MTDLSAFSIIDKFMDVSPRPVSAQGVTTINDGSITASTVARLPTDSASIDMHYNFPVARTVYHTNIYPNNLSHDVIGPDASGQAPIAYASWIKTVPPLPGGISLPRRHPARRVLSPRTRYDSREPPGDVVRPCQEHRSWMGAPKRGSRRPIEEASVAGLSRREPDMKAGLAEQFEMSRGAGSGWLPPAGQAVLNPSFSATRA